MMKKKEMSHSLRDGVNLSDMLKGGQKYFPLYLNVKKESNVTRISLSKGKGDYLYCLSTVDHENPLDYFDVKAPKEESKRNVDEPEEKQGVKRIKRPTLFDYIKRK
jgi:hypothetical protein